MFDKLHIGLFFVFILFVSCRKNKIPKVTTSSVESVTDVSVVCNGNVTSKGKDFISAIGFCWDVNPEPTISDAHSYDGNAVGNMQRTVMGLQKGTKYFVRAYATNSYGTAYGEEISFQTKPFADCDTVIYSKQIVAIMNNACVSCHSGPFPNAGVDLTTYANVKASADAGRLQARINDINNPMPPAGLISQTERNMITCWLQNGEIQ